MWRLALLTRPLLYVMNSLQLLIELLWATWSSFPELRAGCSGCPPACMATAGAQGAHQLCTWLASVWSAGAKLRVSAAADTKRGVVAEAAETRTSVVRFVSLCLSVTGAAWSESLAAFHP